LSERAKNLKAEYYQDNREYLEMLNDTEARQRYFQNLARPNGSDHEEVAHVKALINRLIEEEIALAGFKNQLVQEEARGLPAEKPTKSNFYFNIDENKVDKNLKVYNIEAPGNKYRHPNVILPHEHVNIQHYLDTSNLTQDKLNEIYGYYSLLIDMHIA
jgi:hypothetical protein